MAAAKVSFGAGLGALALSCHQDSFRGWFEAYLEAFNQADFAGIASYYADDVIFRGQALQVVGREGVVEFYRRARGYLQERVDLLAFVGAPDRGKIVAELRTTLVALRDWPDMPTGPMRKGDTRSSVVFAIYELANERFTRIRTARLVGAQGAGR